MGGGLGSTFPHFLFVIICQFNRSDYIPIMCVLDQSSVQPNSFTCPSFPQTPSNIPPSSLRLYHLQRVFFRFTTVRFMLSTLSTAPLIVNAQAKKPPALSPFINGTSTVISNFMAMNSCGFSQEEFSTERERGHSEGIKGLERRINSSAKDWHALKHGIFFEWPSNAVKKSTARLQETRFQLLSCIVRIDFGKTKQTRQLDKILTSRTSHCIWSVFLSITRKRRKSCALIMRQDLESQRAIF